MYVLHGRELTQVRKFQPDDLDDYTTLFNSAEARNPDFKKLTAEEMRKIELESSDYDPDAHFVAIEEGRIVGSGRGMFNPEHAKVRGPMAFFDMYVLPDYFGSEVERELLVRIVDRLRSRGVESLRTRVDTRYESKVRLLERLGFTKTEYQNHGLECSPKDVKEPVLPEGYEIRIARIPEDLETMLRVFNEAFATRDKYPPISMERLRRSWIFDYPDNYSGIFLAQRSSNEVVVGMVMSGVDHRYNEEHETKRGGSFALAVIPSERKKGIGTALLIRSLKWIGERGMETAYISVNVANPDALSIYQSAGYKTVQVYQGYGLKIAHE